MRHIRDAKDSVLRQTLEALAIDYWYDVDMRGGADAPDYYTDGAIFKTSTREYCGREAIARYYAGRDTSRVRVSLHLMQNFRLEVETASRVHCHYFLSLFAADGEPILPSKPAVMIATVSETVVRQTDGTWLYAARLVRPMFRDDTPTLG